MATKQPAPVEKFYTPRAEEPELIQEQPVRGAAWAMTLIAVIILALCLYAYFGGHH